MAVVVANHKPVTVDPLQHSAPLGAVLAFLGVAGCMPLLHSSQGCAAFVKVLLTRHYRESIPLQTSALTEVTTILSSGESLLEGITTVADRLQPEVIGVITTGLVDAAGEDVRGTLKLRSPGPGGPPVVLATVPDLGGGLEQGYATAVEALVAGFALPNIGSVGSHLDGQVTLLPGPALGPLDVEEVRETAEAFGLRTVVLPDSSRSLDGHLDADWEPLLSGGTPLNDVAAAGRSAAVLAVGAGLGNAARMLAGTNAWVVPHAVGLEASDALVMQLAAVAGRQGSAVPESLRQWRSRLTDGLLDASGVLAGRRVALALEPDLLGGVAALLTEAGCHIVTAVTSTLGTAGTIDHLRQMPCDEVVVGDFEDAEERAREAGAELMVASSHGAAAAGRLGIPLLRLGFPVVDRLGAQHLTSLGYRGSLRLLFAVANELLAAPDHSQTSPTTTTTSHH